ncbi:carboxylesterase/lipase family protein [Brevundimonas sp.]|uniref:carboxylesterase/lipase family protein n=1 Tax=Brevundimonas sp. TaxID=1871086 RepID=UPI003BAD35AA
MTDPIVVTRSGPVRGRIENGVARYLGIPYAAPPLGDLRFAAPQPHAPWTEFDAREKGPSAPYPTVDFPALDLEPLVGKGWEKGDDYLNLNVWTPAENAGGLPVMVFIHGGGWTGGAAMAPCQDGTAFARDGVIMISITYRLGVEGWLPIPGAPTNLGKRDMLAALKWVQENVAAFGGDAANVTVFGESAGAMSIGDLVASPAAKGLFRRAIIESGHGSIVRSIPVMERVTKKVAKILKIKPTLEGFRSITIQQGLDALMQVSKPGSGLDLRDDKGHEPAFGVSKFTPVVGDDIIPVMPLDGLKAGVGKEIDVLIGTNADEMNLYLIPTGVRDKAGKLLSWFVLSRSIRNAGKILKAYGMGQKGVKPGDALMQALSDLMFRYPARAYASAHQGRTHFYEFGWRSPAFDNQLGACHALELPFVFDTLATGTGPRGFLGENPPQALADRVHKIWVDFARDGTAPWPEFDDKTRLVYALETGTVHRDPDMPAAKFWS